MNLLAMLIGEMVRASRRARARGGRGVPAVVDLTFLVGRVPPGRN